MSIYFFGLEMNPEEFAKLIIRYHEDKYTSNVGYWKSRIIFKESVRKMKEIYPEEIQKLIDIYEPYAVGGRLADNAPQEAIEALEKVKEWDFKQGQ